MSKKKNRRRKKLVEQKVIDTLDQARQEKEREFQAEFTEGRRVKISPENFTVYLDELQVILQGLPVDYQTFSDRYNRLAIHPADLMIDLTPDQAKLFIKVYFENMNDFTAPSWYPVYDVLLLQRPEFPAVGLTKSIYSGSEDTAGDFIPKSVFIRYISLMIQQYLRVAIQRNDFSWDINLLQQILALLDKNTATLIVEQLIQDDSKRYVYDLLDAIRDFPNFYTQNLAHTIHVNFLLTNPIGCAGAIQALTKFFKFETIHSSDVTLRVKDKAGTNRPFIINRIRKNPIMDEAVKKTRKTCNCCI